MTRNAIVVLIVVSLGCVGCGRAISEGLGEVRGASGIVMPIEPPSTTVNPNQLAEYRCFVLGEIRDDVGGRLSREFLPLLRSEFRDRLAAKKLPTQAGGKTLLIRGQIIHYEDVGTIGNVISPLEEVICRTEFVDQSSNRVVAVVNCIGRTNTSLNRGVKTKAEGLAKAFVSWIDKRYPRAGRPENE
jgi:hypothetical protein